MDFDGWFKEKELDHLSTLEGYEEEVKKESDQNIASKQTINQTSNIISTNKSWKNSYKLKYEIRKILYLFVSV